jgi:hypothetical protein
LARQRNELAAGPVRRPRRAAEIASPSPILMTNPVRLYGFAQSPGGCITSRSPQWLVR